MELHCMNLVANLDHYGLYGEYHEIVLDIAEPTASNNLNVYFNEGENP